MPDYTQTIVFEAEDDAEANQQTGEALLAFASIKRDELLREDGTKVV